MNGRAGRIGTVRAQVTLLTGKSNHLFFSLCSQAASLAIALLDDENSQAEGTMEGAVGGAVYGNIVAAAPAPTSGQQQQQQQQPANNHPHYENIYAPIGQPSNNNNNNNHVAVPIANAPANIEEAQQQQQQQPAPPPTPQQQQQPLPTACEAQQQVVASAAAVVPPPTPPQQQQARILPINSYRNDLYDRSASTAAYDVPRAVRSGLGYRRNFRIDMQNGK